MKWVTYWVGGVKKSQEIGDGLVIRAEATISEFDDVEVKTTDADGLVETKKGTDIEFQTLTISVAKSF